MSKSAIARTLALLAVMDISMSIAKAEISEKTGCREVVAAFDDKDKDAMGKIVAYISDDFKKQDAELVKGGHPSVLAALGDGGLNTVKVGIVSNCDLHPEQSLEKSTSIIFGAMSHLKDPAK